MATHRAARTYAAESVSSPERIVLAGLVCESKSERAAWAASGERTPPRLWHELDEMQAVAPIHYSIIVKDPFGTMVTRYSTVSVQNGPRRVFNLLLSRLCGMVCRLRGRSPLAKNAFDDGQARIGLHVYLKLEGDQ